MPNNITGNEPRLGSEPNATGQEPMLGGDRRQIPAPSIKRKWQPYPGFVIKEKLIPDSWFHGRVWQWVEENAPYFAARYPAPVYNQTSYPFIVLLNYERAYVTSTTPSNIKGRRPDFIGPTFASLREAEQWLVEQQRLAYRAIGATSGAHFVNWMIEIFRACRIYEEL